MCSSHQQIWIERQVGRVKLGWLLISSVCASLADWIRIPPQSQVLTMGETSIESGKGVTT